MGTEGASGCGQVFFLDFIPLMSDKIVLGVHLTGTLNGWATPKDLILHLTGKLTVRVSDSVV